MILLGLGANLPSRVGPPVVTLEAALKALEAGGVKIVAHSRWYRTAPVPVSDQPWFVNGVARVETGLAPADLLALMQKIELSFGRQRGIPNAARTLDLDILDYEGRIEVGPPVLPHPRMDTRAFVLLPLTEIAPNWRHPISGRRVTELLAQLPADIQCPEPLPPPGTSG